MANVLVTGASGFIGQALCKYLRKDGHIITSIVRDDVIESWDVTHNTIYGDITDYNIVRRVISDYEPKYIYHLASQSIVRQCARDPVTAYQVNVMGAVNLMEAIRQSGDMVEKIVVSTSDKAYGHALPPYTEDTPLKPKYTYEATKACQDIVCQNYWHNYNIPICVARCSNVYGPGDPNTSRLIPNTIRLILENKPPQIYQDVASYVREWLYIDDVIKSFILIGEKAPPGENYCVGATTSDFRCSVKEIVEILLTICKSNLQPTYPKRIAKFKEIKEQWMDGTKLHNLGWNPQTSIFDGLETTVKYYSV